MTVKQAQATGLVTKFTGNLGEGCSGNAHLRAAPAANVLYSPSLGVEVIEAYPGVRTPEGIKIGSSRAAVRKAYPEWHPVAEEDQNADGRGYGNASGNAVYRIATVDGKVAEITLQYKNQNCYE
jgi:hypothetical protein